MLDGCWGFLQRTPWLSQLTLENNQTFMFCMPIMILFTLARWDQVRKSS